jgi:hypothetical protein
MRIKPHYALALLWFMTAGQAAGASAIPSLPSIPEALPTAAPSAPPIPPLPPMQQAAPVDDHKAFEVNLKNIKTLPRENAAIVPTLPKAMVPITVPIAAPTPGAPSQAAPSSLPSPMPTAIKASDVPPALPQLPSLPLLDSSPAETASAPAAHAAIEEVKESYEERTYRKQQQRAAKIAKRLRENHRASRIPQALMSSDRSTQTSKSNTYIAPMLTWSILHNNLFKAIDTEELSAIRTLSHRIGSLEISNAVGETPLIYAVKHNKLDAAKLLIALRASPNARDDKQRDALYYARASKNTSLTSYLIASGATAEETMQKEPILEPQAAIIRLEPATAFSLQTHAPHAHTAPLAHAAPAPITLFPIIHP